MARKMFLSLEEAINDFDLDPDDVQLWIQEKRLKAFRFQESVRFKRADIEYLKEETEEKKRRKPSPPSDDWMQPDAGDKAFALQVDPARVNQAQVSLEALLGGGDPEESEVTQPLQQILQRMEEDSDEETFLEPVDERPAEPAPAPPPAPAADEDPLIRFYCPCGKRLKTDRKFIGHPVRCPRCREEVKVPSTSEERRSARGSQTRNILKHILDSYQALRSELTALSRQMADRRPGAEAESTPIGPEEIQRLESSMLELKRDLARLKKEQEQMRFDIARLSDLLSRRSSHEKG